MEDQEQLCRSAARWIAERHGWETDPTTYIALGDVVQGINIAVHTFTDPGDGVIVQGPIYPPFLNTIDTQVRRLVDNRLIDPTGAAELNLDELRQQAADPRTRLMLLCNPHNPSGRVLRRDELEAIAEIALANDLVVLSDEIWMDVIFPGHKHIPFASLGPEIAARTVTMTSATKTFNLGGMRCAVAIFGSPELQQRFDSLPPRVRSAPNSLGIRATIAAWNEGGPWFDSVLRQLDTNRQMVDAFVHERMPGVRHRTPEGTFLAWLDFADLHLGQKASEFLLEHARVGLNDGDMFGGGDSCARLNFATTPAILGEILERMAAALPVRA
jgi:cystathionine beta-lyase